jgi:hypothetical protein
MERYAKVQSSLWSTSKKFKQLTMMEKYVYLYLLTCQHGNSAGMYRLIPTYCAYDCAITLEQFDNSMTSLAEKSLISFDKKESVVLIHQYMKFNQITNDKHAKGTAKVAAEFKESSVYRDWVNEVIPYFKGYDSTIDRAMDSTIDRAMDSTIDSQSIQQSTEYREQKTENRKQKTNEIIKDDASLLPDENNKYKDVFDYYLTLGLFKHRTYNKEMYESMKRAERQLNISTDDMKVMLKRHKEKVEATKNNTYFVKARPLSEFFGQKKVNSTALICSDYLDEFYKKEDVFVPRELKRIPKIM